MGLIPARQKTAPFQAWRAAPRPPDFARARTRHLPGSGLKWSNIYAFSSLGAKAVNIIMTFIFILPAMREMSRTIIGSSGGPEGIISVAMIGGAVGGILVTCIYPILSLILLNRPRTKAWFAAQPG